MSSPERFKEWLERRIGYSRIYLEAIAELPEHIRESLIKDAPHTRFKEVPDPQLSFLLGMDVWLGFENLGLNQADQTALLQAFCGNGVRIPGTSYKLRYHGFVWYTLVEPSNGDEPELPAHWRQVIIVMGDQGVFTWIGKRVRPDQLGAEIDFSLYRDAGDGWELPR